MKRTVMLTAALMFAGMTSLSLAHENMNSGKPAPSRGPAEQRRDGGFSEGGPGEFSSYREDWN